MLALAERFETGRLSSRDCTRIIGAGLRGAGTVIADDQVAAMQADGGVAGYIDVVARLLTITFGGPAAAVAVPAATAVIETAVETITREVTAPDPFPGTR